MLTLVICAFITLFLCAVAYGAGYDKGRNDGVYTTKCYAVYDQNAVRRWKDEFEENEED